MNPLTPRVARRRDILRFYAQDLLHAAGAVHDAAGDIPFEDDAFDRIRCKPKHLLALSKPGLGLLALRDIARIDHDAIDQRVVERGDVNRFEPAIAAVLVAQRGIDG